MAIASAQFDELFEGLSNSARILRNVPGDRLTTIGVGEIVPVIVEPLSISGLQTILQTLFDAGLRWRILGAGSNVLIASKLDEVVIRLGREFQGTAPAGQELEEKLKENLKNVPGRQAAPDLRDSAALEPGERFRFVAYGGTSLMSLSRECSGAGLSGLEFAAGIPASLGGSVVMNAGAHAHSMSEVVHRVWAFAPNGELRRFATDELAYGYRSSIFRGGLNGGPFLIVAAELSLLRADDEAVSERRNSCLAYRKKTQPLHLPSAGSLFTNIPVVEGDPLLFHFNRDEAERFRREGRVPAAALLEAVGLKGERAGGMAISEMHANWLVRSERDGSAEDALKLIRLARERVLERFGVTLESEIVVW